jgi:hypothetical protein
MKHAHGYRRGVIGPEKLPIGLCELDGVWHATVQINPRDYRHVCVPRPGEAVRLSRKAMWRRHRVVDVVAVAAGLAQQGRQQRRRASARRCLGTRGGQQGTRFREQGRDAENGGCHDTPQGFIFGHKWLRTGPDG